MSDHKKINEADETDELLSSLNVVNWPHDPKTGEPLQIVATTFRLSHPLDTGMKFSPTITRGETIYGLVPLGAVDEIDEDREKLHDAVEHMVVNKMFETFKKLGKDLGKEIKEEIAKTKD